MKNFIPVIGLEIHVELATKSKMFCQCKANYFGQKPNSNVCPVCLGMPGALPVPNEQAVKDAQLIGLALNCKVNKQSKFDRKHYFYPDLPKGYQISQYDEPFSANGHLEINGQRFGITRVHLEEDTGKLSHEGEESLIDFNRSGVPLVEIVTEPDFSDTKDIKDFLEELQNIIRALGVSDADMEKGSVRLEPNISLKEKGTKDLPKYKVEVKNINSFKFVQKAVEYEIKRQKELLEKGQTPEQETRGFNENKGETFSQRSKEEAHDYRYFSEPDISAMEFDDKYLQELKERMPELPQQKVANYIKAFRIRERDAFIITRNKKTVEYFEQAVEKVKELNPQEIANLIVNKKVPISGPVEEFIKELKESKKEKVSDSSQIDKTIEEVLKKHEAAVNDYKSGKSSAIMFILGQVMGALKGQGDATIIKQKLESRLK